MNIANTYYHNTQLYGCYHFFFFVVVDLGLFGDWGWSTHVPRQYKVKTGVGVGVCITREIFRIMSFKPAFHLFVTISNSF